jgi:hypothetical protein
MEFLRLLKIQALSVIQVAVSKDGFSNIVYVKLFQIYVFKIINNFGRL